MRIVLLVSSFVVLAISVLNFLDENLVADWRANQVEYRDLLRRVSEEDADSFEIKLRQVYMPEMKRVDRCVSCHVGIEDPRFTTAAHPWKTHPGDHLEHHEVERFGCTVCHDGQGRATNWSDALAWEDGKYWEKPILPAPFLEANCYRCHTETLEETPSYNRGKELFETGGCLGCHQRDGKGGYLAPELRGLGDAAYALKHPTDERREELLARFQNNRNLAYIYESIRFPTAQPADSVMIDYGFSDADALTLVVYLKSLTRPTPGVPPLPLPWAEPLPLLERGGRVFALYCRACHGIAGSGGVANPNYVNGEIPQVNLIAERMFLYESLDAEVMIEAIDKFGDPTLAEELDLPRLPVVLAQYTAIRDLIQNGNPAGKLDPEGPTPFNMPSWRKSIPERDVNAVIAYLISVYPYFEDEE